MMRTPTRSTVATTTLALAAVVLLAAAPAAAEFPKQGEFRATYCFVGNLTTLVQSKADLAFSFELTGTVRGDTPGTLLDMTSIQCVGLGEVRGGKRSGTHQCHFVDQDGDKIYVRAWYGPEGPQRTLEFLGGSGKYAGITGGGETRSLGRFPKIKDGTFQGCTHGGGRYRLP
jgi:hypothetical protein